MRQTAARFIDRERIDCRLVIHESNLAIHIHDVRHAVAHSILAQYSVGFGCLPVAEIAQQAERKIELIGKDLL